MKTKLFCIAVACLFLFATIGQAQQRGGPYTFDELPELQEGQVVVRTPEGYMVMSLDELSSMPSWNQIQMEMEAMDAMMVEQFEKKMITEVLRQFWDGRGANLLTLAAANEDEAVRDAFGISKEQMELIDKRMNAAMESTEEPMFGSSFDQFMEEMGAFSDDGEPNEEAIQRIQEEVMQRMQEHMGDAYERMTSLMINAITDAMDDVLTPEQRQTINEATLANLAELPIVSPEVFEALNLTDAQREQMEWIKKELEPEFEETLEQWVDGALAMEKKIREEYGKALNSLSELSPELLIHDFAERMREFDGEQMPAPGEVVIAAIREDGEVIQYVVDAKVHAEILEEIRVARRHPNFDDIRKRLLAEDPEFKRIATEMQTLSRTFSTRFRMRMFDVLTDAQWMRLQELIDNPPEHALLLRKKMRELLNVGEEVAKESEAGSEAGTEWVPGPGSWQPGDPIPMQYRIERNTRRPFPRGEE